MGEANSHGTLLKASSSSASHHAQPAPFSLRRRVQLCAVMLALESYISFEEIFMLPVLQRVAVPVLLVSMPGTISSAIGVFVIPLLGWASDRMFCCSKLCGQKRPFAVWTLLVTAVGVGILVYVTSASLFDASLLADFLNSTTSVSCNNTNGSSSSLGSSDFLLNGTGMGSFSLACLDNASASLDTGAVAAQNLSGESALLRKSRALAQTMSGPGGLFPPNTSTPQHQITTTTTLPPPPPSPSSPPPPPPPTWQWQTDNATLTSTLPSTQSSTQAALNSSTDPPTTTTSSSSSAEHLTTLGLLGIVGFVLSDHGYDSSMSTFKAYMIAVTPASQHDDIFILGTLTGAVGGCLTSLLGFIDLASLFPEEVGFVLDKGMAQGLVQALILLAKLLLLGLVSLMTGSERCSRDSRDSVEYSPAQDYDHVFDQCGNVKKDYETSFALGNSGNHIDHNENSPLIPESPTCCARLSALWGRWKRRFFLCLMTFLGLSTNYSYFVYVSNYVAEVIFGGDPNANSKSQAYADYVYGVHVASLGMLTFYLLFVVYNVFHQKILNKIGMRAEYLGSSVCCAALMVTLAATDNIVVFFLNAITMATFRAAVYTVPFILSNNLAKKEAAESNGSSAHSSGVAMATITAMIPGSYFMVSLIMGPLMDVSGYAGMPIIVAAGSCLLNIVAALLVHFE